MHNYRFVLDDWLKRCPLEPNHTQFSTYFEGEVVAGPGDLCNNEHLRSALHEQFDWGPGYPADIFVMSNGEPPDRHVTKLGGLPYRPSDEIWPTSSRGDALLFIGQVNFSDSLDIYGQLPGELLLVFAEINDGVFADVHFEWRFRIERPLIEAESIPDHESNFRACYGSLCRCLSYPEAEEKTDNLVINGIEVESSFLLPSYQATQIGPAPYDIQGSAGWDDADILCTISSLQPQLGKPWPWLNQAEQLPKDDWKLRNDYLMMYDVGCLYIGIDQDDNLLWDLVCY